MRPGCASGTNREPRAFGPGLRPGGSAPRVSGEGGAAARARASRERRGGAMRAPRAVVAALRVVAQALPSRPHGAWLGQPGPGTRHRRLRAEARGLRVREAAGPAAWRQCAPVGPSSRPRRAGAQAPAETFLEPSSHSLLLAGLRNQVVS